MSVTVLHHVDLFLNVLNVALSDFKDKLALLLLVGVYTHYISIHYILIATGTEKLYSKLLDSHRRNFGSSVCVHCAIISRSNAS